MNVAIRTVRVNPRWRLCYRGKVYESGETADLDILTAAEWCGWGSATPVSDKRVVKK
jgi:hypothetical protein